MISEKMIIMIWLALKRFDFLFCILPCFLLFAIFTTNLSDVFGKP